MKSAVLSIVVLVTLLLGLSGCGGGSSSGAVESSGTPSSSTNNLPLLPTGITNSIEINPLIELGLEKGNDFCIRIKAYSNSSRSKFSEAICTEISDSKPIELSWNHISQLIIGYEIYYGDTENNTSNFLQNIMIL